MTQIFRIVGPPGTGKTRFLHDQVEAWIDRYGYGPEDFVLTSLTRAAASVLRGRIDVPERNVATLHSLCYRGLGSPPVAEKGKLLKQWNESVEKLGGFTEWTIDKEASIDDDVFKERMREHGTGQMLSRYTYWRVTGRTDYALEQETKFFAKYWEGFKAETHSIDFTDMLEMGMDFETCPGNPPVLMVDEAQDLTPLQWQVISKWMQGTERTIIAGDPAQAIYSFAGATPDNLLTPIATEQYRVLSQGHRMPRELHEYAEHWLSRHSGSMMEGRIYKPTTGYGNVLRTDATWEHPEDLLSEIELRARLGQSVMVLATCSYMLDPIVQMLRQYGIPFHNPHRVSNGKWNPGSAEAHEAAVNLLTDGDDWWSWAAHLPAKYFNGHKKVAHQKPIHEALVGEAFQRVRNGHDWKWYLQECLGNTGALSYELSCMGNEWTSKHVVVGTVHSVKGAEADCVILFPDLSPSAALETQMPEGMDAAIRVGYVGITRAKSELMVCAPQNFGKALEL